MSSFETITVTRKMPQAFEASVFDAEGNVLYTTDPFRTKDLARSAGVDWLNWFQNAPLGGVESIYYILEVPDLWSGPPKDAHTYSGLQMKIGRAKDVLRRIRDLRTGSVGELILHAIEPGSSKRERQLHEQFASDRRQGEWFACSPSLVNHVYSTWKRNRLLPPEHRTAILKLLERIRLYRAIKDDIFYGNPPDMMNPSLNEDWNGNVLVDLVYSRINRISR